MVMDLLAWASLMASPRRIQLIKLLLQMLRASEQITSQPDLPAGSIRT
jgi:hypothetical protein